MAFASAVMALFPAPPQSRSTPVNTRPQQVEGAATSLTLVEKQAVIDDLQLEITKRARGLRSIYNEQARQLRESLERRLHRIPPKMRSETMGELADEHTAKLARPVQLKENAATRGSKRTSDAAFAAEDKENAHVSYPDLQPQKKRPRVVETQQARLMERKAAPNTVNSVLSPRSHNSRTVPSRSVSPQKPSRMLAPQQKPRPVSRAVSRQGTATTRKVAPKKPATTESSDSRDSESSTTSARTTIVKRDVPTTSRAATKKAAPKTAAAATARKRAPAKTEIAAPVTRTLRKRG